MHSLPQLLRQTHTELVLACLLKAEEARHLYLPELLPEDFPIGRERELLAAIQAVYDSGRDVDLVSVHWRLVEDGKSASCPADWWALLPDEIPSTANCRFYVDAVKRDTERRIVAAVAEQAAAAESDTDALVEQLNASKRRRPKTDGADAIMRRTRNEIDVAHMLGVDLPGVPTGMNRLDRLTGGFRRAELAIVGARPSVGKSALATQWALHAAYRRRIPTLMVSLEMKVEWVGARLIAAESGMNSSHFMRNPGASAVAAAHEVQTRLADMPMHATTQARLTVAQIRHEAEVLVARENLRLVIVDYLGLVEPSDPQLPRYEQVTGVSRDLKLLAMDLDVAVVALSQVRREADRQSRPPLLSDLRESGAIEQDADLVLFLHRERLEDDVKLAKNGLLLVAKQRNGDVDSIPVRFDRNRVAFEEVEP